MTKTILTKLFNKNNTTKNNNVLDIKENAVAEIKPIMYQAKLSDNSKKLLKN